MRDEEEFFMGRLDQLTRQMEIFQNHLIMLEKRITELESTLGKGKNKEIP